MTRRVMTILLVAFAVALGSSYLAWRLVRGTMAQGSTTKATSKVLVAKRNLEVGTVVKKADVGLADWVGAPPKGVATREEDVIERGVVSTLYEGEPISAPGWLCPEPGEAWPRPSLLACALCAVRVDQVVGMAGFVVPGMRVDVLILGSPPGGTAADGAKVKTVLQNVEVLSAGQNIQKDASGKPVEVQVVSLLVTPEQAEILSLASNESKIQLVLRNPLDNEAVQDRGKHHGPPVQRSEGSAAGAARRPAAQSRGGRRREAAQAGAAFDDRRCRRPRRISLK